VTDLTDEIRSIPSGGWVFHRFVRFSKGVHPSLGRRLAPAVGLLTLGLVVGTLGVPAASADDTTTITEPVVESTDAATDALTEVQDIVDGAAGSGRDLTMALRELRLHQDELSPTDRAAARKLLKRPPTTYSWTSEQVQQFGNVLVHWEPGTVTPAYVAEVGSVVTQVLGTYAAAGYRAPKPDGANGGGTDLLDIYLVDFAAHGDLGLYGFCDADAFPPQNGPYDAAAYCAFDNDYAGFPGTPENNLMVTAAHELFHAVQFAYDYEEDRWFLEATATWAEDELFDDVNDNWQYLASSPLRQPRQSLDQFSDSSLRQYGEWIFFRYLTERWSKSQGGMPVIMRRLMERIDAAKGGPDNYSMQAIERELRSKGTTMAKVYAEFSDANRRPKVTYEEGSSAAYKAARPSATWTLTKRRPDTGARSTRINHLASATARLVPGKGVSGRSWKARVTVELPARAGAIVSTYRTDGVIKTQHVRVDRHGRGKVAVRFDGRSIRYVEVTLVNTSTRYKCWVGAVGPQSSPTYYSCRGKPKDQNQRMLVRARAVR